MTPVTLTTNRLIMRPWREEDLAPFAAMSADPAVMEHFPNTLTRAESDAMAVNLMAQFSTLGYGRWVLELPGIAPFIGMTGLNAVPYETPFTPAHEIAWRLARPYWGQGYVTEAARATLRFAFEELALAELVAFTTTTNLPSQAVMQRLGMTRDPEEDFDHPRLPEGDRLRRHVLYRMRRENWLNNKAGQMA